MPRSNLPLNENVAKKKETSRKKHHFGIFMFLLLFIYLFARWFNRIHFHFMYEIDKCNERCMITLFSLQYNLELNWYIHWLSANTEMVDNKQRINSIERANDRTYIKWSSDHCISWIRIKKLHNSCADHTHSILQCVNCASGLDEKICSIEKHKADKSWLIAWAKRRQWSHSSNEWW